MVLVTGCLACSRSESASPSGEAARKVFGIAIWEPETIDPSRVAEESGITIASALFEGLLRWPVGNGPMRSGVAERWESTPGGLEWVFHIRPDARWSDGRHVTSGDFLYAWKRALEPETGARLASHLFVIEGAEAFHRGSIAFEDVGVSAPDDRTLKLRLRLPVPWFANLLATPPFFPLRRDVIDTHGTRWTRPGNLVGNGPFVLGEFRPGDRAVLERNPNWWNASKVALDGVVFHFLASQNLAYEWFRAGKIQWLKSSLSRDHIPLLRRTMPPEFRVDPMLCTGYVTLRVERPPLDDIRLRKALALSVDRERLVREVLMGGQAVARSFVPPSIRDETGYSPPVGVDFDPGRARELLKEFRRDKGDPPVLSYVFNTGEANRIIAEFLQGQWREHLGLEVRVEATEWKTLLARVRSGDYMMARASWCADVVDPGNFLDIMGGSSPNNYPGFSDPGYDELLARAAATPESDSRAAILNQAEARMLESMPVVPLYHFTRIYLLDPKVTGFKPHLLDFHPLEDLDIRP
jgi:oligopeptide transport system substrate-binding protein